MKRKTVEGKDKKDENVGGMTIELLKRKDRSICIVVLSPVSCYVCLKLNENACQYS